MRRPPPRIDCSAMVRSAMVRSSPVCSSPVRSSLRSGPVRSGPTAAGTLIALSTLLLSCGGGDSPTPPGTGDDGQTVVVSVTTTGVDLDADGYTVRLGTRSATVGASGTATFDDVAPGSYDLRLDGVANNCLVEGAATRTVSVSASAGASASFTVGCATDFADGVPTVACSGLAFSASSSRPLDRVPAGSIPAALSPPLAARVLDRDGEATSYTWFHDDGQGGPALVTPLHPSGTREGGEVWIRVTDGAAGCPPIAFTIEALPAAPGETGRSIDALQAVVREQAAVLETTPEALRAATLDGVETALLPLWTLQWVLDHPDNDNALRRFADGTATEPADLDLLDALLAHVGFVETLVDAAPVGSAFRAGPLATVSASQCTPQAIGADGDALANCMLGVRDLDAKLLNWANQLAGLLPDILRQWDAIQQAPGIASAIVAGLGWAALQADTELYAALPSTITNAEVQARPAFYNEDDDQNGAWTLDVEATSLGWDATRAAVEGFANATIDAATAAMNIPDPDYRAQIRALLGAQVAAGLQNRAIPPQTFGPARMTGESWSKVEYRTPAGGTVAVAKVDHHTYKPVVAGTAILKVTTPGLVAYGGPETVVEKDIVVDSIRIVVNPSVTFVAPGARDVPFTVGVLGASNLDPISITAAQGTAVRGADGVGAPGFFVTYNPPASPSFTNPDSIHVEYTGRTGPVATAPKRFGFAIVKFGEIVITPRPACLDTLEQRTFSAEVRGVDNPDVTWTAAFGTIDANGNYQAPATRPAGGVDTITATSVAESQLTGEIVVPIGCTCNFRLTLGNQVVTAQTGDQMVFNTENGRLWQVRASRPSQNWTVSMLPVDSDEASRPNAPGTWPMVIQGDMGLTNPDDVIYATDPPPAATLNLAALVPNQAVQGTVNGPVTVVSTSDPRILNADFFFAIRYAPGEFTCTVGGGP